jgi:hypothetical protein
MVLIFSCEQKKTTTVVEVKNGDTTKTITTTEGSDTDYSKKFKDESREMELKLKELGEKAKKKGGELGNSIKDRTNKMDEERKGFQVDSSASKGKTNEEWQKFKEKSKAAIDSLEKKLK